MLTELYQLAYLFTLYGEESEEIYDIADQIRECLYRLAEQEIYYDVFYNEKKKYLEVFEYATKGE